MSGKKSKDNKPAKGVKPLTRSQRLQIYEHMQQNPDLSQPQLAAIFGDKFGFKVSRDMIRSLKKSAEVKKLHSMKLSDNQRKKLDAKKYMDINKIEEYLQIGSKGSNLFRPQQGAAVTIAGQNMTQYNQELNKDKNKQQAGVQEEEIMELTPQTIRGALQPGLKSMMYGFGDAQNPLPETQDLVEDLAMEYLFSILDRALEQNKMKDKITTQDIIFLVRKDPRKLARCHELLRQIKLVGKYTDRKGFEGIQGQENLDKLAEDDVIAQAR